MADNTPIYLYAGGTPYDNVATDDVAGVKFQRMKLDVGGDGVTAPLLPGQQPMAGSLPVVLASNQTVIPVFPTGGSTTITGTVAVQPIKSSFASTVFVPASLVNVILLASNAARLGAAVHNTSTGVLWLRLGAPVSPGLYTLTIASLGYYEVPFNYTGIIYGQWSVASSGACVTEFG